MTGERTSEQWEEARKKMLARWNEVLRLISVRDQAGVLVLANVFDEFCEQASAERKTRPAHASAEALALASKDPPPAFGHGPAARCLYCEGFSQHGGCFGAVEGVSRAVTSGDWPAAAVLAREYLGRIQAMTFPPER